MEVILIKVFMYVGPGFRVIAQDGNIVQSRSYTDQCQQAGMENFNQDRVVSKCEDLSREVVELLTAEDCPTEKMDLVLHSDQMLLQIHESIGHALEVDRILGDERNYAGWSFVNLEDFGKLKYGSDLMNITFDPTIPEEFASYGFDDSGNKASKEFIIKDGVLLRGLGGLESQERSKLDGVANVRACSWNRAPIDRMANLNLEPGNSTFKDIISSVEKGIFMQTNRSWSIDDFRNKFQFGCEYAQLIENGEITKTVKNPNYRAISTPFWNSLKMVGNQDTFGVYGTPYCGKGEPNQGIRLVMLRLYVFLKILKFLEELKMDNYFNKINEYLFSLLTNEEILKVGMWGETSQFIRLNNSKIRQTGIIDDMSYSLALIANRRQVSCSTTLNGDVELDKNHLLNILNSLRCDIKKYLKILI